MIGRRFHECCVAALAFCAGDAAQSHQWFGFAITAAFVALAIHLGPDRLTEMIGTTDGDRRRPW